MSRSEFRADFQWQLQFADAIRRIVGPHLIAAAPMRLDKQEATDFMIFDARDRRIAARVRRPNTRREYWRDITLRSWRSSGARTEWAKILEDGFAHWMFYGRHTGHFRQFDPWYLIDLDVFRALYAEHGDKLVCQHKRNTDGTTGFNVIRPGDIVRNFDRADLLIAWEFQGHRHQRHLFGGAA